MGFRGILILDVQSGSGFELNILICIRLKTLVRNLDSTVLQCHIVLRCVGRKKRGDIQAVVASNTCHLQIMMRRILFIEVRHNLIS